MDCRVKHGNDGLMPAARAHQFARFAAHQAGADGKAAHRGACRPAERERAGERDGGLATANNATPSKMYCSQITKT